VFVGSTAELVKFLKSNKEWTQVVI
jgi:hypothetical protein